MWLTGAALAHQGENVPPWQAATDWPDRIVTTVMDDPATSFAVTWRTDDSVGRTLAQIVKASPDTRFDIGAETVPAETEALNLAHFVTPDGVADYLENAQLGVTHHHSVVFRDLDPDTLYAFRVMGARGNWSEWFQIRTAPRSGPFSFVYMGDAQQGVRTHWARVIRMAHEVDPKARFFLHAGDLVQNGPSDHDWGGWFSAGSYLHAQIATLPVIGNHDHMRVVTEDGRGPRVPTPMWRAQFTLPVDKSLPEDLRELVFAVHYSPDLDIFVLDSTPSKFNLEGGYKVQSAWLKKQLAASKARWKIVTMHHPYFYPLDLGGREDAAKEMREAYAPVIERGDVDLVLTGHIHFYSRASTPAGGKAPPAGAAGGRAMTGDPRAVGTMYVVSAAAASQDNVVAPGLVQSGLGDGAPDDGGLSVDRVAENTPMFQTIDIDGPKLTLKAYMATGDIYDAFTLEQVDDGKRTILVDGPAASGDTRLFEQNTGPYRNWYDLQ
ncbi:MAG: metallophosphoesterase family protein [Hyphomonadaceae bacterium]